MLTVIRSYDDAQFAFPDRLYVRGDDDGLWYEAGFTYDSVTGVYLWNVGSSSLPSGTFNISDTLIGSTMWRMDADDVWHQLVMTETDTPGGYVWTDYSQTTSQPTATRRVPRARAEDGIYIADVNGYQIHKMGVTGGLWAELTQGYTVPL